MTFDQWIDAVDARVHGRLGGLVRTAELSWDSAMWTYHGHAVTAAVTDDEANATVSFDNGERQLFRLAAPEAAAEAIAGRMATF